MQAATLPLAEGAATVTLRGAKHDAATNTLDLTNVRLSVTQVAVVVSVMIGLAGAWAVLIWRMEDTAKRLDTLTQIVTKVQLDNARRDGAEHSGR